MASPLLSTSHMRAVMRPLRSELNKTESGLHGLDGTRTVIIAIQEFVPGTLKILRLSHNALGDIGTKALLEFLTSNRDTHPVEVIDLNHVQMGEEGLRALIAYLHDNLHLRELKLQYNLFDGDGDIGALLASALNTSRLRSLTLTSNLLSDAFASAFFSGLASTSLVHIAMSNVQLSSASVPVICIHLTSRTSPQYETILMNGNSLTHQGVQAIITACARGQFRLTRCEFYANWSALGGDNEQWLPLREALTRSSERNRALKRDTRHQALSLLYCARPALIRPAAVRALPHELVVLVFRALAWRLSFTQRERVLAYAADACTLPPPSSRKLPVLSHDALPPAWKSPYEKMVSAQDAWLEVVGCHVFDPDGYASDSE